MNFNFDLSKPITNAIELFNAGMDRAVKEISPVGGHGTFVNLGPGTKDFPWAKGLQRPEWIAGRDEIPFEDDSVDGIVAFHFFEHLTGDEIAIVMAQCYNKLKSGGTLSICVPHRLGGMAFQDLDHKSFFTENSWRILFNNEYYTTKATSSFEICYNLIMGDSERTLALITQMRKP